MQTVEEPCSGTTTVVLFGGGGLLLLNERQPERTSGIRSETSQNRCMVVSPYSAIVRSQHAHIASHHRVNNRATAR